MAVRLSKGNYNLVCVAHPDDETIFFGGLIMSETRKEVERRPWAVVCVTFDGSEKRKDQFYRACHELGVEQVFWWEFPDKYDERLNTEELIQRLQNSFLESPHSVYTHGIIGEYGHPHHQDVSFAVHCAFKGHANLFAASYNAFPDFEILLSREEFEKKGRILTEIYGSETSRFLNVLPATFAEGFLRLDFSEVEAAYSYLASPDFDQDIDVEKLKTYKWLAHYLPNLRGLKRLF